MELNVSQNESENHAQNHLIPRSPGLGSDSTRPGLSTSPSPGLSTTPSSPDTTNGRAGRALPNVPTTVPAVQAAPTKTVPVPATAATVVEPAAEAAAVASKASKEVLREVYSLGKPKQTIVKPKLTIGEACSVKVLGGSTGWFHNDPHPPAESTEARAETYGIEGSEASALS